MTMVETPEDFAALLAFIKQSPWVVVDIETTGLDVRRSDKIIGVGIGNLDHQFWVSFDRWKNHKQDLWNALNTVPELVGQNIKFDLGGLSNNGFKPTIKQTLSDDLVLARLCIYDRFPDLSLTDLLARFISPSAALYDFEFKKLIGVKKKFNAAGERNLAIYCMNDVRSEALIYDLLSKRITSRGLSDLWKYQQRLTASLFRMEDFGIKIDTNYCKTAIGQIDTRCAKIESDIKAVVNLDLNYNASRDLSKLFKELGVASSVKTKTGADSWAENALLVIDHPVASLVRELRSLQKMKNTYFDPYLNMVDSNDRIHPVFKNWGTVTGRLAGAEPNTQNIPKLKMTFSDDITIDSATAEMVKNLMGAKKTSNVGGATGSFMSWISHLTEDFDESKHISVRRAFITDPGRTLIGFDYSQIEMRIFYSYLNNPKITEMVNREGWDAHNWVVETVWGLKQDDKRFDFYRSLAKAINFGLIYGIGIKKLANQIDKSIDETREFRDIYFSQIPEAKVFSKLIEKRVTNRGYVHNRYGRRYSVTPDKAYLLINYLTQGTAGEYVCHRLNDVDEFLLKQSTKIVNNIHDELVYEVDDKEAPDILYSIKKLMENQELGVYLPTDISVYHPSVAHKHKFKEKNDKTS